VGLTRLRDRALLGVALTTVLVLAGCGGGVNLEVGDNTVAPITSETASTP